MNDSELHREIDVVLGVTQPNNDLDNQTSTETPDFTTQKHTSKRFKAALAIIFVSILLCSALFAPFFENESIISVLFSQERQLPMLGDNQPYDYEYFTSPANSFGIGNTTFKTVNWTYFKNLFKNNITGTLKYRINGGDWQNGNQYLTIDKTWIDDHWKINLTFDNPSHQDIDAYFEIKCNRAFTEYVNRSDVYTYDITYPCGSGEYYNVSFNFSDLVDVADIVKLFRNGNEIGCRFYKENVPFGVWTFDPWFGNNVGSSYLALNYNGEYLIGCYGTVGGVSGTADNITFRLYDNPFEGEWIHCALYQYLDNDTNYAGLNIKNTTSINVSGYSSGDYVVCPFSDPKPSLEADTRYYLVVALDGDYDLGTRQYRIYANNGANDFRISKQDVNGIIFQYNLTGESGSTYKMPLLYCSYTEGGGPSNSPPTISNSHVYDSGYKKSYYMNGSCFPKSPTNLNFTHNDTDSSLVNWTIYENNSGSWKTVASGTNSPANATNYTTNTSWISSCDTKYYIHINITDGDDWTNSTFWFETLGPPSIISVTPSNGSGCIDVPPNNISIQISEPCGYPMRTNLYENSSGGWLLFNGSSGLSNGTYNYTNTSWIDSCNTTYWWRLILWNSEECYHNETYHFTTAGPPVQSNPVPANNTGCVDPYSKFNITVNDPCGNLMNVVLETNETGTWKMFNHSYGVPNGTYYFSNSGWVTGCNTTYWWRAIVNNSNGCYSNETYTFTTVGPSSTCCPSPFDGESCVACDTNFSIKAWDPCGETMDIDLFYNDTKLGYWVLFNSTNGVSNGTFDFTNNTWVTNCGVNHYWAVNITNSEGCYTNNTYMFTTVSEPQVTIISPLDKESGTELTPTVEVWANDTCGSLLTVEWYEKVGAGYDLKQTNSSVAANTTVRWVFTNASVFCTAYYWMVKVNNSCCTNTTTAEFATLDDTACIFLNENPANKSIDQNLAFTWNVTIQSPNGTTFDWTIECSSGASNNANGDTNGSKTLVLAALASSTNYTVWVNTTTSSCGQTHDEWFWFITKAAANDPPVQGQEIPNNGSVCICTDSPTINIKTNDPNGDLMNISAQENSSGVWKEFNSSSSVANGTFTYRNTSWIDSCNTTYWWMIILDDGQNYTNATYHFTTSDYPTIFVVYPANGSSSISVQPTVEIYANDTCGRDLDVFWYENTTGSWVLRQTNSTVTANTTVEWGYSQAVAYDTTYWWMVALNSTCCNASWIVHFTTGVAPNNCPVLSNENPTNGTGSVANSTANFSIMINDSDGDLFNWSIEASTGDTNSSTLDNNGTYHVNFTTPLTNCATIYIYVNVTDGNCTVNETFWFTVNCPSTLTIEIYYPTNNSTGLCPCCMYIGLNVSSPNGELMNISARSNWSGAWQYIQFSPLFANVSNGTYYFLPMEFILYNHTYYWNATVDNGTNTVDTATYHFTTAASPDLCEYGSGGGYLIPPSRVISIIGLIGLFGLLGLIYNRRRKKNEY